MQSYVEKHIETFFQEIGCFNDAYKDNSFSFIALRKDDVFQIIRARLLLNARSNQTYPYRQFRTARVWAGSFSLSDLNVDAKSFTLDLLSGTVETPSGKLQFRPNEAGKYGSRFEPLHPDGIKLQTRFNVLTILGNATELARQDPLIDWELKAAPTPYENLLDLAQEFQVSPLTDVASVEIVGFNVVGFDFSKSLVAGTRATVTVKLSPDLTPEKVALGYRVFSQSKIIERSMVHGKDMRWEKGEFQVGVAETDVAEAAVLQCYLSYGGVVQQYGWVSDPTTVQNVRRAVYEQFDGKLANLADIIAKAQKRGDAARDLEAAVAWLLWMLGFSVAQLGAIPRTQEFVDLVATTPSGHFAVIEVTTGLLKADHKLSLLVQRADMTRKAIDAVNHRHLRVLPVIVTSRTREEVAADLEQAEKLGVLVVTRETLDAAFDRTLILANPEQIFQEGEQAVRAALAKYQNLNPFDLTNAGA